MVLLQFLELLYFLIVLFVCLYHEYILYRCDGSEMKLGSCEHTTGRAAQSCGHEGDVGIECHVPDMSQCIEKSVTYQVSMNYYKKEF